MYSQSEADLVRENRMLSEQLELAHRAQAGLSLDVRSLSEQLADAQATVEALQRERDGLEQNCLNNHVTIEQADAKVMKLEGERGMWATERIDLLTQLENAEFALDAEREKVTVRENDARLYLGQLHRAQSQLSALQGLVRVYFTEPDPHKWTAAYRALKRMGRTLPATPTERGQG